MNSLIQMQRSREKQIHYYGMTHLQMFCTRIFYAIRNQKQHIIALTLSLSAQGLTATEIALRSNNKNHCGSLRSSSVLNQLLWSLACSYFLKNMIYMRPFCKKIVLLSVERKALPLVHWLLAKRLVNLNGLKQGIMLLLNVQILCRVSVFGLYQ